MPILPLTYADVSDGWAIFEGPEELLRKVAHVSTKDYHGLKRGERAIMEPLPQANWQIHLCSPVLTLPMMRALIELIPTLPPAPAP